MITLLPYLTMPARKPRVPVAWVLRLRGEVVAVYPDAGAEAAAAAVRDADRLGAVLDVVPWTDAEVLDHG